MRWWRLLAESGGDCLEAARRAGVAKRTMYRRLKQGLQEEPLAVIQARCEPRPRIVPNLASLTALTQNRLAAYPDLSDTRLFAECRAAGYAGGISQRLGTLGFRSLMVIDAIGYLPITRTAAMRFFQLLDRRDERASSILTSGKGFEEWGEIVGDEFMAAALIGRLVHLCHIVNIRGNGYRLRQHAELARRLHGPPASPPSVVDVAPRPPLTCRASPNSSVPFSLGGSVTFSIGVDKMPYSALRPDFDTTHAGVSRARFLPAFNAV